MTEVIKADTARAAGCRLEDYAKRNQISISQVWNLIEDGTVRARQLGKDIVILTTDGFSEPDSEVRDSSASITLLASNTPEPIDSWHLGHLLAEQLQRLQQEMTNDKREIITMQRQQIEDLSHKVSEKDQMILKLQQKIEDLDILTKTLNHALTPPQER